MDIVGYLITLSNLKTFGGQEINEISVKAEPVVTLAQDLKHFPNFALDDFRETGFTRKGDMGIYLSKRLRDYLFENGDPNEEGIIIYFFYEYESENSRNIDPVHSYIIRKHEGFEEDDIHTTFGGQEINEISVKAEPVVTLAQDLKHFPNFALDDFRETGFTRKGDMGIYLSKRLRDYLFENGDPNEEGIIIYFFYEYESENSRNIDPVHSYIIRKHEGFEEDDIHTVIDKHLLKI